MKSLVFPVLAFFCAPSFAQVSFTENPDPRQEIDQLIQKYQYSKALVLLDQLDDSLSVDVLQRKGSCYLQMGNYDDAIRQYETVLKVDSTDVKALYALGQLYARNKQFMDSYACYETLIANDELNSIYYKQYGIVAVQAHAPALAFANFLRAVELNPGDIEAYTVLGEMLLDVEEYRMADSLLSIALETNSSPQLVFLLAKAQMGEHKYNDAIKTTEQLMVAGDTIPGYARVLGISYFRLDEFEEALSWLKYMLENDYKADWVYFYAGICYQRMDNLDLAIVYLNKAVEEGISKNIGDYYLQLATCYEAAKDFKKAIKFYKVAYEYSKKDILLYHLAVNYDVYYKDKTQAIAYFRKYLDSDDTVKLAREYSRYKLNELEFYR